MGEESVIETQETIDTLPVPKPEETVKKEGKTYSIYSRKLKTVSLAKEIAVREIRPSEIGKELTLLQNNRLLITY
jgi:hypothetical protein